MGKELEKTRKGWDSKPLNEKDQNLYDLRDIAQFKGPIDQDGKIPKKGGDR